MMPWSGLSLTLFKHAYEMGTLELHRTGIRLTPKALTTNRSMYPKDLSRQPQRKYGTARDLNDPLWRIKSFARSGLTEPLPLPKSRL